MDLTKIRRALADHVQQNIAGHVNVYAAEQSNMVAPGVLVQAADDHLTYHETWRTHGVISVRYDLLIRGAGSPESAIADCDRLLSFGAPDSIVEALRRHGPIDDLGCKAMVRSASGPVADETGASASITVEIYPPLEA